jgi:2-oxoglutarate dehydrogenase E1 component
MSNEKASPPSINSWLEEELYQQYLNNRQAVADSWQQIFDSEQSNGAHSGNGVPVAAPTPVTAPIEEPKPTPAPASSVPAPAPKAVTAPSVEAGDADQLVPLRGAAARIAENMNLSLTVPTATSQRVLPVKVIDENRRILNEHRELGGKSKLSYTHLIGWAIVQAVKAHPNLNNAYAEQDGAPFRVVRGQINFGVAVDVAGKDGVRSLVVPSIKDCGRMTFSQYLKAFDELIARARTAKLTLEDFQGTTISLTNPGTVGTVGSVPRLMPGQGAIIATGAMDYPAEYAGVAPEVKAALGLSKVMTVTCTYDHRVIQGAESGTFLGRLQELLQGADGFYDAIYADLGIPYKPVVWQADSFAPALPGVAAAATKAEVNKEAAILQLINAYRVRGHLIANLNPLGDEARLHPELDPATYGLSIWDLDREFHFGGLGHLTGNAAPKPVCTLREILETLRRAYCGKIGVEYMNIQHPEEKRWIQSRLETPEAHAPLSPDEKIRVLEALLQAEMFEQFLHNRFKGQKRFSLEGGESAMAILEEACERAGAAGVQEIVIGMAHRGRLTVLTNLIGKTAAQIFSKFEGDLSEDSTQGSGDVKYHIGASGLKVTRSGKEVVVSVASNPSHLEAVDPVVEGMARARQARLGDDQRERVIPVLVHGDAAFAGQGVVSETLNLSQLLGYTTGGTFHLVINNQIGFTTNPSESRSTVYCTDIARSIQAPIFHVNGDDPEACVRVARIAFDYRQKFKKDAVIDMVCYRKHGHNEGDDPSYTQPLMYAKIKVQPSPVTQYRERLLRERVVTEQQIDGVRKRISAWLEEGFEQSKKSAEGFETVEVTQERPEPPQGSTIRTSISRETFDRLIDRLHALPDDFHVNDKLARNFIAKRKEAAHGGPIDWALAEAIAFGATLLEGIPVRLSGQDSSRGTFSQRHLEFFDTETGAEHVPMKHLAPGQAKFECVDSSLSEFAVMGFEYGYSVAEPNALVMWEAQFGDFGNGAQITIDQFVVSGETKWGQQSSLVLLLPHGYEGQGPEHSSARIERFLNLCAEDNIFVCNATTPAQYFHLLRRQLSLRKPLVVFTPKSILRSPKAVSRAEELTSGAFREVLGDTAANAGDRTKRVIFCSGKVYYDLAQAREEKQAWNVAIIRLEQLYPFPAGQVRDVLARYSPNADLVWVQEEPRNMGAWRFVEERMGMALGPNGRRIRYVGRAPSPSPSTGSAITHLAEQTELVNEAFAAEMVVRPPRTRKKLVKRRRAG